MDNETALATVEPSVHLVARNPQEMALSRNSLLDWMTKKSELAATELRDIEEIREHARKSKWRVSSLDRQTKLAKQRLNFYVKIRQTIEAGYTIVPNFPIDLFAIRVKRQTPNAKSTESSYSVTNVRDEKPEHLPAGEGRYVSPNQLVRDSTYTEKNSKGEDVKRYVQVAADLQEVAFPLTAARVEVMQATSAAMALRLFDQIGICPQRVRRGDPLIIGQISMPTPGGYADPQIVSFLIAWYLDLRTI